MKNPRYERNRRTQREYHRNQGWRAHHAGLYIPHSYAEMAPDALSWWDDVGFILNRRRVMVFWRHPRDRYRLEIVDRAWRALGDDNPGDNWLTDGTTPNYARAGKSRKRIICHTSRQPSAEQREFYDRLNDAERRMTQDGIDFEVEPSWKRECLSWATWITLVAPLEVRNEIELAAVAKLARRLLLGQTTLSAEFPGYRYDRADWLAEQPTEAAASTTPP